MAFRVGQEIENYRILRLVSSMGAATVYEVENLEAGRRELLKALPAELTSDPEVVERFLREAKIHSGLDHPNIAVFYKGFEVGDQLAMTMEAVAGRPLEDRLSEGPLDMTEAIDVATGALNALQYAHDRGVVHREVTPGTLYLCEDGSVKLTGFGLARQTTDPRLTQPGLMLGSVYYMSPEQVKGLGELDGRTDIYSLGVVLYEMIGGSRPFESRSQFDIIQAHVMKEPPPLTDLREDVPVEVEAVVMRALEKFPDQRYASASGFRAALLEARKVARAVEMRERPLTLRPPMEDLEDELEEGRRMETPVIVPSRRPKRLAGGTRPDSAFAAPEPADAAPSLDGTPRPAGAGAATATWDEEEGWRTRDLVIVGALTFIMVIALVMAVLVLFDA